MAKGVIFQDELNTQRFITKRILTYAQKLQHLAGNYWPDKSVYIDAISKDVRGADVIQMVSSDPLDIQTPDFVKDATKKYLDENVTHYMDNINTKGELRKAIAQKLKTINGRDVDPEQIYVEAGGGMAAVRFMLHPFLEEGDEVLFHDPHFQSNVRLAAVTGATPVSVPLIPDENTREVTIIREDWERKITPRTKAIMIVNPSNPGGKLWTRKELEIIADIAIKNDLLVLSDDVYDMMIYDDNKHFSIANLPEMAGRTVTAYCLSKVYRMTGWRIGYTVYPTVECAKNAKRIGIAMCGGIPAFCAKAAVEAVKHSAELKEIHRKVNQPKRDLSFKRFSEMEDLWIWNGKAKAGCNHLINISAYMEDDEKFTGQMLKNAHVGLTPGSERGFQGRGFVRSVFIQEPIERLQIGLDRFENELRRIRKG